MKTFVHVKNSNDTIIRFENYQNDYNPASVSHKYGPDKEIRIVPYEIDNDPIFNPENEKVILERKILADKVYDQKKVVALTAGELAEIADEKLRDLKMDAVISQISDLRDWADTANNTIVDEANHIAVLQEVVSNLSKFYDMFANLIEGRRYDK